MRLLTLHDILTSWQAGEVSTDEALARAQIRTEAELREAAMLSGVLPMRPLTSEEQAHRDFVDGILASTGERH